MFFTILTPPRPYTDLPRKVVSQIIGAGGNTMINRCSYCRTVIIFGGIRAGKRRFCGKQCEGRMLAGPTQSPQRAGQLTTSSQSSASGIIGSLIVVAAAWWFGYTFWYAPSHKEQGSVQPATASDQLLISGKMR